MAYTEDPIKVLHVRMSENLYHTLKNLAKEDETSITEYVKGMIKEKAKKNERRRKKH